MNSLIRQHDLVGPAADIYSLGIVAYEALTGRRPFEAAITHEYYALHRQADVPLVGDNLPARARSSRTTRHAAIRGGTTPRHSLP